MQKIFFDTYDQDMYQQLEGGSGSINPMLPVWACEALEQKMDQ